MENQNTSMPNWGDIREPQNTPDSPTNWESVDESQKEQQTSTNWEWDTSSPDTPINGDKQNSNWGDQNIQSTPENNVDEISTETEYSTPSTDFSYLDEVSYIKNSSYLGSFNKIQIDTKVWNLNHNNEQIYNDLLSNRPNKLDEDGRYECNPQPNSELENLINTIFNIGKDQGLKLNHCFLLKTQPNESHLNITKGNPKYNFIYFIQAKYNSGDIILDFSSIKGPSLKALDSNTSTLSLIPGWVPYRITKNTSDKEMIAIVGNFI